MKAMNYLRKIQYKNRQRAIDKQYEREGLTDDVLRKQVELNQQRYEHDISDDSKRIYDKYVQ